jgi:hypothetical protein
MSETRISGVTDDDGDVAPRHQPFSPKLVMSIMAAATMQDDDRWGDAVPAWTAYFGANTHRLDSGARLHHIRVADVVLGSRVLIH